MKKLIAFLHISLDGYANDINGAIDWIKIDDGMFDFVGNLTAQADTALYGRVTYELMNNYWPTAGEQPNATKHDLEHSQWYNSVQKIVLSKKIKTSGEENTLIVSDTDEIIKIKQGAGKNILLFGSPTITQVLLNLKLIDELWLFVNPVILSKGINLFSDINEKINLQLIENKLFGCGVTGLHYSVDY